MAIGKDSRRAHTAMVIRIPAEVPPAPSDLTVIPATTPLRLDENTFKASVFKGDWKNARNFISSDGNLLKTPISVHSRIALHVAACEGYWEFLEELVKIMPEKDLELSDALGCTALHYAAVGGSIRACKALVRRNHNLTQLTSNYGWTPLLSAAQCAPKDKDVVCYLSSVTTDGSPGHPFSGNLAGILACSLAAGGFHDILLYLIHKYPGLATAKDDDGLNILDALALRPWDFQSGSNLGFWKKWIYNC